MHREQIDLEVLDGLKIVRAVMTPTLSVLEVPTLVDLHPPPVKVTTVL
jgi:hypothetical protein